MRVSEEYFNSKTEEISFISLREDKTLELKDLTLDKDLPLPVVTNRLLTELNKLDDNNGITIQRVIEGILHLIGADQDFIHREEYGKILDGILSKPEEEIFAMGLTKLEEGDLDESGLIFRAFNSLYGSRDSEFYYAMVLEGMGRKYFDRGDLDLGNKFLEESTTILEELLNEDTTFYPAYYKLGYHYKFYEQFTKAKLTWDKVLVYDPDENRRQEIRQEIALIDLDSRVELGLSYLNNMMYEDAIEVLIKLMPKEIKNWYINYLLGMAYRGYGDNLTAIEYFYQALDNEENPQDVYNELGITYFNDGNIEKAISIFTEGIDKLEEDYRLYFNRGLGYLNLGLIDKGYEDIKIAASLNPEYENIQVQLNAIEKFYE